MITVFAKRFHELRNLKGETQKDLAEEFNVSRGMISHWEQGRYYPEMAKAIEIAAYFNVSLDYLVGNTDEYGNPTTEKKDLPTDIPVSREEFRKRIESTSLAQQIYALPKEKQELILKVIKELITGIK